MAIIKIEIKDNIATNITPEIEIVSANEEYQVEFSFDSTWEKSSLKTARFWYNFKHVDVVFQGNICKIPPLEETELVKVGVFTDTNKTTTDAEIKCRYSIKKYGGKVQEPSKSVYGQLIEAINNGLLQGSLKFELVSQLPTENINESAIYLVYLNNGSQDNKYAEYIYINDNWEKIGEVSIEIDLSNYLEKTNENLETKSKDIVGAINEVNEKIGEKEFAFEDDGNGNVTITNLSFIENAEGGAF